MGAFLESYNGAFSWDEFIKLTVIAVLMAVAGTLQPEKKEEDLETPSDIATHDRFINSNRR